MITTLRLVRAPGMVAPGGLGWRCRSRWIGGRTSSTSDVLHNETLGAFLPTGAEYPDEVACRAEAVFTGIDQRRTRARPSRTTGGRNQAKMPMFPTAGLNGRGPQPATMRVGRQSGVSSRPQASLQQVRPSMCEYDELRVILTDRVVDEVAAESALSVVHTAMPRAQPSTSTRIGGVARRTFDGAERAISTTDRHGSTMYKTYGPFGALYKTTDADAAGNVVG